MGGWRVDNGRPQPFVRNLLGPCVSSAGTIPWHLAMGQGGVSDEIQQNKLHVLKSFSHFGTATVPHLLSLNGSIFPSPRTAPGVASRSKDDPSLIISVSLSSFGQWMCLRCVSSPYFWRSMISRDRKYRNQSLASMRLLICVLLGGT